VTRPSRPATSIEVKFGPPISGVSAAWVRKIVTAALKKEKAGLKAVSVWVTDNPAIRRVNRKYLGHDYATDVISFWFEPETLAKTETEFLGDLVVSAQMAWQVSGRMKIPFRQELARYLVHGTLHLLGYDDKAPREQKKMHRRQEEILKGLE